MSQGRIPLFPLEVVLFPGAPLPLHIFESRYKLMVGRCLDTQREFGMVLERSDGIAPVGCTAEIVKIVKRYADGRMDILTIGQTAYRVMEVFDDEPYLEGTVEYLEDDLRPGSPETQQRLLALFGQCHSLIYGRPPRSPEAHAATSPAFYVASELPLDLECKQELLEIRVESERQSRLLERLKQWLPQLTYLDRVRAKASGNGHGLS